MAVASVQEGVFIAEVKYDSDIDANKVFSKVNNYVQTTLNSSVSLSNTNANSSITYTITMYNNSNFNYFFVGTNYLEEFYDNLGITFELEGIELFDILQAKNQMTFKIKFAYKDNTLAESNVLNSYIDFLFESAHNRVIAELVYKGESTKKIVSLDDGTTTFNVSDIEGTVIRANSGAIPKLASNTITLTQITDNTICKVFDSLEESVETSDTTVNNMLMIANEDVTFEDTEAIEVASNQKINLDINGMEINASTINKDVNYITNYGVLKIKDSTDSGYIKSNYRVIGNNGELTLESGTYERTAEDVYCGGTVTNFEGTAILKNSTLIADSTAAFLNWGTEKTISLIDNCTLYTNTGDTVINGSYDSEISISNSTITSTSGAALKGAYLLSGGSDEYCGPTYVCNSTLSASVCDYYVPGLGKFYYTTDVTFMSGNNTPSSNNSEELVKNYISTTDNQWYKVKTRTANGVEGIAKYSDGNIIRVGDKVKISTLLSSDFAVDTESGNVESGENIILYAKEEIDSQEYTFLASSVENNYLIVPYSDSSLSINIVQPIQSGSNLQMYTCSDAEDERFEIIAYDSTNGSYNISSTYDLYLDIDGKAASNLQDIIVATPDGTDAQKWKIERIENPEL